MTAAIPVGQPVSELASRAWAARAPGAKTPPTTKHAMAAKTRRRGFPQLGITYPPLPIAHLNVPLCEASVALSSWATGRLTGQESQSALHFLRGDHRDH